jgi:hypothetical protein
VAEPTGNERMDPAFKKLAVILLVDGVRSKMHSWS